MCEKIINYWLDLIKDKKDNLEKINKVLSEDEETQEEWELDL